MVEGGLVLADHTDSELLRFPLDFPPGDDYTIPPQFLQLQEERPVCPVVAPSGTRFWLLTRDADVRAAFEDPRLSRALAYDGAPRLAGDDLTSLPHCVFNIEGDRHESLRRAIVPLFDAEGLLAWSTRAAVETERLLRDARDRGGVFDLRREFAEPLLLRLGEQLLGVSESESAELHSILEAQTALDTSAQSVGEATVRLRAFAGALLDMPAPPHGLLESLQRARRAGRITGPEELSTACFLLFNTIDPLAPPLILGVRKLLSDGQPGVDASGPRSRLVVNEIMRYCNNSLVNFPRVAEEDLEIGGQRISHGEAVLTSTLSAGWDRRSVENPSAFEISRVHKTPLAFGAGRHRCLGLEFTTRVLQSVIGTLFSVAPTLKLLDGSSDQSTGSAFLFVPPVARVSL